MAKPANPYVYMPSLAKKNERTWQIRIIANLLRPFIRALFSVEVIGADKLPKTGAYILAANHVTNLDALGLAYAMYFKLHRAPHFLAKEALFRVPIVGPVFRACGQIPVLRGGRNNVDPMAAAHEVIRAGQIIGIFPEGTLTREPNGWPMRGKTGAMRLAIESGVPIFAVGQWGTEAVMGTYESKITPKPWHKMTLVIGEQVDLSKFVDAKLGTAEMVEASETVMAAITKQVEILRGEKAPTKKFVPSEHGLTEHGNFKKALRIQQENERRVAAGLEPLPAGSNVKANGKVKIAKSKKRKATEPKANDRVTH